MKLKFAFILAIVSASLLSCKREPAPVNIDGNLTVKAASDLFRWADGDAVNLFTGEIIEKYVLVGGAGSNSASFKGDPFSGEEFFALYPYQKDAYQTNGRVVATLPAEQEAMSDGSGHGTGLMIASGTGSSLELRQVGSIISFEITDNTVGEVLISGKNGEILAGRAAIAWNDGKPSLFTDSGAVTQISVKPAGGADAFEPGVYYASVLASELPDGVKLTTKPAKSVLLDKPYGIAARMHWPGSTASFKDRMVGGMKSIGADWVRTDCNWSWMNQSKNSWNFTFFDDNAASAEKYGVELLPILAYDVEWCRPVVDYLDDWADYVTRVVERYGDRIGTWEVYNEPNHKSYWHGEDPDAVRYTQLLKRTYEVIKGIDPGFTVIAGGLAGVPLAYLETCLKNGAADCCEAFNIHPYHITGKPEDLIADIDNVNALLKKYDCPDKPLWITEVGWNTPDPVGANGVTQEVQARYVPRTYILMFAKNVKRVFWFEYRAPESTADDYREHYGLVHSDLTIKPAYTAYGAMTAQLPSGSSRPSVINDGNLWTAHWQNPEGKDVWAFWSADVTVQATLDWEGGLESASDLYGKPVTLSKGSVSVDGAVTYVTGPSSLSLKL